MLVTIRCISYLDSFASHDIPTGMPFVAVREESESYGTEDETGRGDGDDLRGGECRFN